MVRASVGPIGAMQRLQRAIDEHDLDALVDCFDPDVVSEQPAHPSRGFRGAEAVRANWTQILGGVPDLQARLLRCTADGDLAWAEWAWNGTRRDGVPFRMRGITISEVRGRRVRSVRFYMEPEDRTAVDVADAIQQAVSS